MLRRGRPLYLWCRDILPFTWSSTFLIVLSIWAFRDFAIELNDYFIRAAIFVFLMMAAFLLSSTVLIRLRIARSLRGLDFAEYEDESIRGQSLTMVNQSGNFKWWPLIEVNVESREPNRYQVLETRTSNKDSLVITPLRRGQVEQLKLRFWVGDIFGIFKTAIDHNVRCSLSISPRLPSLEAAELHLPNEGDETAHPAGALAGDYVDMRRYAPGDPQRFILWKAFAKSRKLLIRTPERAESNEPAIALVLLTSQQDQAAADVTRYFLEGRQHTLAFGACGLDTLAFDTPSALSLLQASGMVESPSIQTVCAALGPVIEKSGGRMVVVASPSDPRLDSRLRTLENTLGIRPYVLLASESTQPMEQTRWARWGLIRPPIRDDESSKLRRVIAELRKHAVGFEVVNPATGRRWLQKDWV